MGWMVTQWQKTKGEYEAATNKKKPGKKFLGFYTRASGIEPALEKLDKVNAFDFKARGPALEVLKKKVAEYLGVLEKAVNAERAENPDAAVKTNMELALKALKKDVQLLLARADADYQKDLADQKAQIGAKAVAEAKKGQGKGVVNFGPDVKVKEELVAAVREVDALMAKFAVRPLADNFNESGVYRGVLRLSNALSKWDKEFAADVRALSPFTKPMPPSADAKSVKLFTDQVKIVLGRLKPKLGM